MASNKGVPLKLDSENTIVRKIITSTTSQNTPQTVTPLQTIPVAQYDVVSATEASATALSLPSSVTVADAYQPSTVDNTMGSNGLAPRAIKNPSMAGKLTASSGVDLVQNIPNNTINVQYNAFNAASVMLS